VNHEQQKIWDRIQTYNIAGSQSDIFIKKLMTELDCSKSYCKGAETEYKRFIFLAAISTAPVTPSKIIDSVWHTHLLFSRSYWQEFCPEIVGKALHHEPSGDEDADKMNQQFHQTLSLYQQYFGISPPPEYCLSTESTKGKASKHQTAYASGAIALAGVMGVAVAESSDYIEPKADLVSIGLFIALVVAFYFIYKLFTGSSKKNKTKTKNNNNSGSGCSSSDCSSSCGSSCGGGGD